jgi:hypothetical protein
METSLSRIDFILIMIASLIFTGLCLYAAWSNLVDHKITSFGFDAFIVYIATLFYKEQALTIHQSPKRIKRLGFFMVLFAIGGINEIVTLIWPLK